MMKLGVFLPQVGPLAEAAGLRDLAQMIEALGFDSAWVNDHVVIPWQQSRPYVRSRDGRFPVAPETPFLEAVTVLGYLVGVTRRLRLGTGVLVVPWRNPVLTAKQLATLDVLSGGRLIVGVGAGWWPEEFAALATPFADRGRRTDEYLEVIRRCWTERHTGFHGRYYDLDDVGCFPKPAQRPHPPLVVGGASPGALRRAGRVGDGWQPAGLSDGEIAAGWERVRAEARAAGRDAAALLLSVQVRLRWADDDEAEQAVAALRRLRAQGAGQVVLEFAAADLTAARRQLERFMSAVWPAVA